MPVHTHTVYMLNRPSNRRCDRLVTNWKISQANLPLWNVSMKLLTGFDFNAKYRPFMRITFVGPKSSNLELSSLRNFHTELESSFRKKKNRRKFRFFVCEIYRFSTYIKEWLNYFHSLMWALNIYVDINFD